VSQFRLLNHQAAENEICRTPECNWMQRTASSGRNIPRAAESQVQRLKVLELTMDIIRVIFAILLPPLGVFLQVGLGGAFWLNILLTLLGYFPGVLHAIWVIARR
jgi:uncharacterized membrane protein YqaE (UPF0057 family)